MTHSILHIDASIKPAGSISKDLTRAIVDRLRGAHTDSDLIYRDLGANPVPETDAAWIVAVNTPADQRNAEQSEIAALSDQLIAELKAADTVVIGLPVYNFNLPSQLKTWFDQMARAGETFRYSESGPEGLVKGTRAIIAYSSNGTRLGSDIDFASGYLRHMLGFFGITDVQFVASDHFAIDAEASLNAANEGIANLAA
ncbi:FMN-dependent NADH-azoreductase [Thalassovita gelatinovora]|uniref:FMN dependent NADH:quinone oxidoreductase n=1 Tax=Thalassovita gelatinovora TaxID=53501 RepID=A0A0N7LW50_THAGE|nr:NAD(P)H-dependent oxidoreductase [Thalassovita gelatinovora]QIZ81636.1 FMN-dependent NADH-azoreductase [Thalassovita gelatinovora]CUH68114.1 FMN-dependent NADH-azoreductase [Thalassovita gelatinovora]SEQ29456.1 FMN-dependent NADH-azoreductase [Thalassovita gelatinovora]